MEIGTEDGHTLLPRSILVDCIERIPVEADCPISNDVIDSLGSDLAEVVNKINLESGDIGFQLIRYSETSEIIRDLG